ncbi:protein unc-50 homolog [Liolophura sinensis]|uniref:protein unc-50 homolog n=1 Tax=Liolophura sinensis TaxID=3198878 RepID=UPI003158424E
MMSNYGKAHASPPPSVNGSPPMSPVPGAGPEQMWGASTGDNTRLRARLTATAKRSKYLGRLLKFRQMDFEYAFWQMLYLFVSPQKVYRNFQYRKQTKDQWARDDPAFLVLLSFWLFVSSIGFSLSLHLGITGFIKFFLWVVFVDCIGVGILIASLFWLIMNRYMITMPRRGQDVEWGYAFDVHLNAFFPLLMILHLFQLVFYYALIDNDRFVGCLVGNTCWLIALTYYIYITFLGYSALPFLKNTRSILFAITGIILVYLLSLIFKWNFTRGLCSFYTKRVM